jgi:hypothetical protein
LDDGFVPINYQLTNLPTYQLLFTRKLSMDLSKLPPAVVSQLTSAVEEYILASRRKYLPSASAFSEQQLEPLRAFFPADVQSKARGVVLHGSRIQDPPFYSMARMMGIRNLPSFSEVAAVTFVDVIVSHEEFTPDLLFHEMVHAVQYAQMGSKQFAELYVQGFIQGGSYEEIPLEKNAHELEARFSAGTNGIFSVAAEVRSWMDSGRF